MENKRLNQEQFNPGPGHMNLPPVDVFFSLVDWFIEVDISIEEPMIKWIGPNWSATFFFQLVKQRLNMFAATPCLTSGGYEDKVDVITPTNILFRGGGEF